jgi:MOSC domain-containing protein YiiM
MPEHRAGRVVSVQVGRPREVAWRGKTVLTSIWKEAVAGAVRVGRLGLDGDAQSDLSVHGGVEKAVYAYPSEHYAWWREQLGVERLPWGAFGENLTLEGLLEGELGIGDRLRIGTAELHVTQPRTPCFKLGVRFGDPAMVKRFLASGRSGFYLAVECEGALRAGDDVAVVARHPQLLTVAEAADLQTERVRDPERLRRAAEHPALAESWRREFAERLAR